LRREISPSASSCCRADLTLARLTPWAVFSDHALISHYAEVEVPLARAEARCGVIPAEAAEQIAARSSVDKLDIDLMRHEIDIVGYPILPLVHQLANLCGEAGRYVHWGATIQDIMDSAIALQVRDAPALVDDDIETLRGILAGLAQRRRDTAIAGRTHLQQAVPITFGYGQSSNDGFPTVLHIAHRAGAEQPPPSDTGRAARLALLVQSALGLGELKLPDDGLTSSIMTGKRNATPAEVLVPGRSRGLTLP
jgi:argininosuccinate lyase